MRVLSHGHPPQPPTAFDAAAVSDAVFDPPLAKETPPKVLKTGKPPQPPPAFEVRYRGEFDPPLPQLQQFPSVPKVLATGLRPQPPPAFESDGCARADFDPPIFFGAAEEAADAEEGAAEEGTAEEASAASASVTAPAPAAHGGGDSAAPTAEAPSGEEPAPASAAPPRRGYRIKRKQPPVAAPAAS